MEDRNIPDDAQPSLASELAAIPHEPLLPVEKKLIAGSLILGILLLGLLLWISATFFPVVTAPTASSPKTSAGDRPAGEILAAIHHVRPPSFGRWIWRL